jgi:hypothetical protein
MGVCFNGGDGERLKMVMESGLKRMEVHSCMDSGHICLTLGLLVLQVTADMARLLCGPGGQSMLIYSTKHKGFWGLFITLHTAPWY